MIAWLIETFVAVTLLMLMVLLLRGPVARSFGAGWAYALWAVPALRLVLPPLPQLAPDLLFPPVIFSIPTAEMAAPLPAQAGPGQWVPFMLAMWAGGAVIFLILQWLGYRAFLGRIRDSARPARPPLFGGIRTWISEAVEGPLALGVIERRIVLPGNFSRRYNPVERRLALEHELVHHKRGDIWWNLVATLVLAILWFNPVAWWSFRAFRSDQELACDAAVARTASLDERCDYARALVKSASRPGLIAACALNPAGELKRRLRMMRGHRSSRLRSTGGIVALAAFAMAAFALGSAGQPPAVETPAPYAFAPALTESAAPVRLAAATVAAIPKPAVAARRHIRKAAIPTRARHAVEPVSLASVEAPVLRASALESMVAMLGGLPRSVTPTNAMPSAQRILASSVAVQYPNGAEGQIVRFTRQVHAEAHVFAIGPALSEREEAEIRQAVIQAAAAGRKLELLVRRGESPAGGGGQGSGFDLHIQTLEKGE